MNVASLPAKQLSLLMKSRWKKGQTNKKKHEENKVNVCLQTEGIFKKLAAIL